MVDLLFCELMKLKRSKMLLISFLGALVTPAMTFIGIIKFRVEKPGYVVSYFSFLSQCSQYMIILFGLVVYTVIAAYLFSREHTESTLKTILTVPVSKLSFITAKFITLLIWILALTAITWISAVIFALLCGSVGFHFGSMLLSACQYFAGAFLMFLAISPFIFLSIWLKGLVVPIIAATTVVMGNVTLSGESLAALFPWTATYLLVTGGIEQTGYPAWVAIAGILTAGIAGIGGSMFYFIREDVK